MNQKPKRPPSVWISQIILVIYSLIFLGALLMTLFALGNLNTGGGAPTLILLAFLFFGFFIAILATAFWGLLKRRSWGRWLTVGIFSLMILMSITQTLMCMVDGTVPAAYRSGQIFGAGVIIVPFAFLIFRLAIGDAAYDFFNPPDEPEEMFEPPPPPTFAE
ncbi:MAG TPA: hypothetical protein PLK77_09610 [Pyrinomonadaceae bacterium]|nr:hypothetical protein [Pyrinomonadaceae bacterium]